MRSKLAAEPNSRTPLVRAAQVNRCADDSRADSTDLHASCKVVRASHATSAERRRWWAHWTHGRLIEHGISNRTLADGWWSCAETIVRDVLTGRKALGPERLELLPEEIAEDFLVEFTRQTFGARAIPVLARVMGKLAKEG